jgi:hypothetical protein
MAQSQDGSFSLETEPRQEWTPGSAYSVRLTVGGDGGNPDFRYTDPLFDADSLDLGVVEDCIILMATEADKGLSWSLDTDAFSLKDSADERYYFSLKYVDRGVAFDRASFPQGRKCTQICFGARLNVDRPERNRHAFSLNVELERDGRVLPILIDPDIQNPRA